MIKNSYMLLNGKCFLIYIFISLLFIQKSFAQNLSTINKTEKTYFISLNFGTQMSGIKHEDFISRNYSPLYNITIGKWFTKQFAMQIGYRGLFFYTIADDIKHHYNYLYTEVVMNLSNFVNLSRVDKNWKVLLHGGPGYFYNYLYGKPNLCLNVGIQNYYQIQEQFAININITAIIGWDIYQGNKDILPGVTLGLVWTFSE